MIQFDQEPIVITHPIEVHDGTKTLYLHEWNQAKISKWLKWLDVPHTAKSFTIGWFDEYDVDVVCHDLNNNKGGAL